MADGTRFKLLDYSVKALQEVQKQNQAAPEDLRSDFTFIEKVLNKVLVQLSSLTPRSKSTDDSSSNSFHDGGNTVLGHHKPASIHLPQFAGSHPKRWVAQALRYFDFYSISDLDQMTIASFYLDDDAADWYDWMIRHHKLAGWSAFTEALIQRFRVRELEEPEDLLSKLQQTSTVSEYRHRFEEISTRTMDLPPTFLVRCFISGLRANIKQSVLIHQPQ
ncbi:hypothetical protein E3N88_15131 [Mikania micrantha]|uniref:Retrotransposon gag domain-containing protein n=1 Tax=Mikania micrantha TaxID=192012 RepID=A0A5N6NWE3_9ASTR|nr:hypothetical protein E3N88_15131 [Mikania micrantha]